MRLPVEQLFDLTNADFLNPQDFKHKCQTFANFDATNSNDDLWNFVMNADTNLQFAVSVWVEPTGAKKDSGYPELLQTGISCGILPFCFWESYDQSAHQSTQKHKANSNSDQSTVERADYDRLFHDVLFETSEKLGKPLLQGHDKDANAHQYAIWRGRNGLLILQQSAHDVQFGYDINFWVQPWKGADPIPGSPFINWLHNRSLIPPAIALPDMWVACGAGLEKELEKEVGLNLLHPLRGVKATSVARREDNDDVLFLLHDHSHHLAVVHLTWNREILPAFPSTQLYKSWAQWLSAESHYE
jgi:hypothetical protein